MKDDFEALDAYGVLGDNTLTGVLAVIKSAIASGVNPHARMIISRKDVNGLYIYNETYSMKIDTEAQIVFMECDD